MTEEKQKLLIKIFDDLLKEKEDIIHLRGPLHLSYPLGVMETRIVKIMADINTFSQIGEIEFMTEITTIHSLVDLQIQKELGKSLTEKQLACLTLSDFILEGETLVIRR